MANFGTGRPHFDMERNYGNVKGRAILANGEAGMNGTRPDLKRISLFAQSAVTFVAAAACATVKVQAPDKPIEINMNVNIKQEVLIKMDKEIQDLIANNPDIF